MRLWLLWTAKRSSIETTPVMPQTHGIAVLSIHYAGDPDRDPLIHPEWKQKERKTYSSQAAWDREQEMVDEAGGGELVFADTLLTYWNKIVITDPGWRPSPHWRVEAGFDHGKTNPTALLRAYIDGDGVIYLCGEYYMPRERSLATRWRAPQDAGHPSCVRLLRRSQHL